MNIPSDSATFKRAQPAEFKWCNDDLRVHIRRSGFLTGDGALVFLQFHENQHQVRSTYFINRAGKRLDSTELGETQPIEVWVARLNTGSWAPCSAEITYS